MIVTLGEICLWLAFFLSFAGSWFGFFFASKKDQPSQLLPLFAFIVWGLLTFAFVCLTYAFATSDFSVWLVVQHSNSQLPLFYKMAAVWGNHEGSLLLWIWVLSFMAVVLIFINNYYLHVVKRNKIVYLHFFNKTLAVQKSLVFLFLGFLLFTSNPFWRVSPPLNEGLDLNPLLQDPGLVFHPPLLYLGYVGLSIVFSLTVAALLICQITREFFMITRFFVLVTWMFLTLGIIGGSFWAYYELGWGGFWFWDPVENVSLVPWLLVTALLHSIKVTEKTGQLLQWTLLLSLLTFSVSLLGTFLVRSGILTSVHSFATDPARGVYILILLTIIIGGSMWLYALRAKQILIQKTNSIKFLMISRSGILLLNNLLLLTIAATVLFGTLYPLLLEIFTSTRISVGAPYFNITTLPFFAILSLLLGFGYFLPWQISAYHNLKKLYQLLWKKLQIPLLVSFGVTMIAGYYFFQHWLAAIIAAFISILLVTTAMADIVSKWRNKQFSSLTNFFRYTAAPVAHLAFGIVIWSVVATSLFGQNMSFQIKQGEEFLFANKHFKLQQLFLKTGKNYQALVAEIVENKISGNMMFYPEKRIYFAGNRETTETSIKVTMLANYYFAIGAIEPETQTIIVRAYYQPFATYIFVGGIILFIGGAFASMALLLQWHRNFKIDTKVL